MAKNIPKNIEHLLGALEDDAYLLHGCLEDFLAGDGAHLRQITTVLRSLVCHSSGLEGLLWRLCIMLGVNDEVELRHRGSLDQSGRFKNAALFVTTQWDVSPTDGISGTCSFREHVKVHEALVVKGESVTAEALVKRLAEEIGWAHEGRDISSRLAHASFFELGSAPSYFPIVERIARLTLQVAERVMTAAEKGGYTRRRSPPPAPSPIKSHERKYAFLPTVPTVKWNNHEGSIWFEIPTMDDYEATGFPGRSYPVIKVGSAKMSCTVTKRRRLKLHADGLPFPNFGCEIDLRDVAFPLVVGLIWGGFKTAVVVNGRQACGDPVDIDLKLVCAPVHVSGQPGPKTCGATDQNSPEVRSA